MTASPSLAQIVGYPILRLLNPRDSDCLAYLAGALFFAVGVALWRRRGRASVKLSTIQQVIGTRRLWLHTSTQLDLKLYFMHSILMVAGYGLFEGSSEMWRAATDALLAAVAGPAHPLHGPVWLVATACTAAEVLLLELGYWAVHFAFHRIPALWEVHKVHHSAEVMTPLTEFRQHPIEFVAFANVVTLTNGVAFSLIGWLFGPSAQPFTLFQINAILVLHFATFHHIRHSGVWIAATGWLGRLVHSPAHHQIHHSTDPRHFDTNLGYALSLWDWVFGTLCIPERRASVRLGVPGEPAYRGVVDTLVRPIKAMLPGAAKLRAASGA